MSITISHRLPIINGYVSIPDGQILAPTSLLAIDVLDLIPGSKIIRLNGGRPVVGPESVSGSFTQTYTINSTTTHRQDKTQLYLELPAFSTEDGTPSDWYKTLRTAAGI